MGSAADQVAVSSTKSMIGHCLAAAGAIESVACILQLKDQFLAPNLNCNDIHPEIANLIAPRCIPKDYTQKPLNIVAKASFGFGDVNACVLFKRYKA